MRDLKYIVKRILIGVGIVLVLGFINNAKASALTWDDMQPVAQVHSNSANLDFIVYYDSTSNRYYYYSSNMPNNYNRYTINANTMPYVFISWNYTNNNFDCYLSSSPLYYYIDNYNHIAYRTNSSVNNINVMLVSFYTTTTDTSSKGQVANYQYHDTVTDYVSVVGHTSGDRWRSSNYNIYGLASPGVLYHEATYDFLPGVSTSFNSWNYTRVSNNNIITSYIFRPNFTNFDTTKFVYQYKIGSNSNIWLSLISNEQEIRVNNNVEIYLRIKDLSDNVLDSANFTITNIGKEYSSTEYNINFSGEYRTSNDLENNHSSTQSVITEYQIAIDYIPKNSLLKYQYQFITSGSCTSNNNWKNVSPSDNGSKTYVTNVNGTLCARILDSEDNQKYEHTFVVNSIGKLAIDSNSKGVGGLFAKISNKVNFSGPISEIINIPIELISTISLGLSGGLTCSPYPLGSLWGTNLVIPCVNIRQHLGNSLYTTIDLLIACVMIYHIIKMFGELYANLLFIHKNPIQDLGKRGD